MMAKEVSQRYQNASYLIEDLDAVAAGNSPQYAQPALDFAKLAEVAKGTPAEQSTAQKNDNNPLFGMVLPLLIASVVINLILVLLLLLL